MRTVLRRQSEEEEQRSKKQGCNVSAGGNSGVPKQWAHRATTVHWIPRRKDNIYIYIQVVKRLRWWQRGFLFRLVLEGGTRRKVNRGKLAGPQGCQSRCLMDWIFFDKPVRSWGLIGELQGTREQLGIGL